MVYTFISKAKHLITSIQFNERLRLNSTIRHFIMFVTNINRFFPFCVLCLERNALSINLFTKVQNLSEMNSNTLDDEYVNKHR